MDKKQMKEQANLAFEFIEKLNFEISYLIKEIEGLLKREDEEFAIGKPGGYRITASSSTGLDYPDWWWYKKLSVFFLPKGKTKTIGGRTVTSLQKDIKTIYLIITLTDKNISSPKVALGILYDIREKNKSDKKLEPLLSWYFNAIWDLAMNYPNFSEGKFEDKYVELKGKFIVKDLFDINNTQDIQKKLLIPTLKQYRST